MSATPFGKVPVLEFDGKTVVQSIAIARYLGTQAGLGGNNAFENLQIDIIVDTIGDYRQGMFRNKYAFIYNSKFYI